MDCKPFTLLLEIDGLCAFVPSENRRSMTLVFVNGTGGGGIQSAHYHGHVPAHYAFMRFQQLSLYPPLLDHHRQVRLGRSTHVRFFDWEDVHIVTETPPSDPYLRIENGRRPGSAEPYRPSEEVDFSWLIELEKIDPGAGRINRACLDPDPPRNLVIGRVFFDDGRIGAESVVRDGNGRPILWEFQALDGSQVSPSCQALASRIIYALEICDPYVTLRFSKYKSGYMDYVDFKFRPIPGSEKDEVTIVLSNRPLEEAVGLEGYAGSRTDQTPHFSLLYRLAEQQPTTIYLPRPVSYPGFSDGGTVAGGNTLCLGGTYSGG